MSWSLFNKIIINYIFWSTHTCIFNWSLQFFSQHYELPSHTTYVAFVHFIHEWQNLQFEVDPEPHIFENFSFAFSFTLIVFARNSTPYGRFFDELFMAILFTLRFFATNLLRGNRRKNTFFYFVLMSDLQLKSWLCVL